MPEPKELVALARKLTSGLAAALVEGDQVFEGRRLTRDFENVLFTPVDPTAEIPWRDGFFTLVYAPALQEPTLDVIRVLAPGGAAVLAGSVYEKR